MLRLHRTICGTYDEWRAMRREEAEGVVSTTTGGLVKRTSSYDPDVLAWLQERGQRLDRSVDWQIREFLRAAMDAEKTAARSAERGL